MRYSWLLVLMLLGIILMGAIPAGAASGAGPYYATPSWDQTMPDSTRFVTLTNFNNQAILDRETGLVWEYQPLYKYMTMHDAQLHCNGLTTGGRYGWRLPTANELASLMSYNPLGGALPPINCVIFLYAQTLSYWTSTILIDDPTRAIIIYMRNDYTNILNNDSILGGTTHQTWCVRAPN